MMQKIEKQTIPFLLQQSVASFGIKEALTTVGQSPVTYNQLQVKIDAVVSFLESTGIEPGDKVALLSSNMPNWAITYFAILKMGAVAVPLLPDFSTFEIETILNHSEARALFVSNNLEYKVKEIGSVNIQLIFGIEDYRIISGEKIVFEQDQKPEKTYTVEETDLATIIYTSGTTGTSKGVMLSHKNIVSNVLACSQIQEINSSDRFLSILPLSHAYENTIGLILPMFCGSCVYYLTKPPTPAVLLPALKEVRPTLMLSVPLIIEKIYRNKVLAEINGKLLTRLLYKIPPMRKKFHEIAGKKLKVTFGGELKFFGIGGAKLNATVEKFLRDARFPYAIGYGLTETAPLLAGANPQHIKLQSTGPFVEGLEYKLNNTDAKTGEGEIWVKGPNVMMGYYKEPKLTQEVLTQDGWFKTGDLGKLDNNNFLYIKGRLKNMIVGPNGENIYPEDIESVINNFRYVVESLVVQEKGKLVAMVHFNKEELEKRYQHLKDEVTHFVEERMDDLINELQIYVNARVNKYSKVQLVLVQPEPFQKTATQKIKRYIYS